jgi:Urease accessory protein UreF
MAHALAFPGWRTRCRRHCAPFRWAKARASACSPLLTPDIPAAVQQARNLQHRMDDWQSFSPLLAILSSQHETQYSRLFRS